jgi:anti-sigma regulatory factor (Ser/Thr protein kinase)
MDEYMSYPRVWGLSCPGFPEEISRARRWVREILGEQPCADDAVLIVSELGTNALRHTASGEPSGAFHVVLALSKHALAISVTDDGKSDTSPEVKHPGPEATQGRGLDMVSLLATHLDVRPSSHGQTVTAELVMPRSAPGSLPCS